MLNINIPHKELSKVEGFEGLTGYYIDIKGNVYSTRQKNKGVRIIKPFYAGKKDARYLRVYLYDKGKKITVYIHQLVAKAFIPKTNRKRFVIHKSGNIQDNSLENIITVNKRSFKKDHRAGRPKKEYIEKIERELFLSNEILEELKILYSASLIKGNYNGSEFDFVNEIFEDLIDEYANRKGLKKILYQLKNEQ